ncbi:hypothetical protein Hanom_Chr02g00102111 [Helianthus anomalus]
MFGVYNGHGGRDVADRVDYLFFVIVCSRSYAVKMLSGQRSKSGAAFYHQPCTIQVLIIICSCTSSF